MLYFFTVRSIPGGPPPLRGLAGSDRYGLPGLRHKDAELVRVHNLLAQRTAQAVAVMVKLGRCAIVEQPALRDGEPSMYRLDDFIKLMQNPDVAHTVAPQCSFGSPAKKLTSWLTLGTCFDDMVKTCTHEARQWFEGKTGRVVVSAHSPARGRRLFYKSLEEALECTHPDDNYVTGRLAAYSSLLNRYLALKAKLACSKLRPRLLSSVVPPTGGRLASGLDWNLKVGRERVNFLQQLKGTPAIDAKAEEETRAVGGLRDTSKTVSKLGSSALFGRALGNELMSAVTQNLMSHTKAGTRDKSWVELMCSNVGSEVPMPAPAEAVECVRSIIAKHARHDLRDKLPTAQDCTTDIDASLLEAWRKAAMDPDTAVCQWLLTGAPAGTGSN